jgi:hypothetical protein
MRSEGFEDLEFLKKSTSFSCCDRWPQHVIRLGSLFLYLFWRENITFHMKNN